ncbi:MAG: hypothetical protein JWM25_1982 [Thermoleophilia bacterium]|nr:hypothetical protein [Thermoleophilia bacterium]
MEWLDAIRQRMADPALRQVLAPQGDIDLSEKGSIWATYRGPGSTQVLDALEAKGVITAEQRAAGAALNAGRAPGATVPAEAGASRLGASLSFPSTGVPASTVASEGYQGGAMVQELMRTGRLTSNPYAPGAAAAPALVDAPSHLLAQPDIAPQGVAGAVDGAVDDVAARAAGLEADVAASLQRLGALTPELRMGVVATAVDTRAANFGSDDVLTLLSKSLADAPLEESAPSLRAALDTIVPLAPEHVPTPTHVSAAPIADDVASAAADLAAKVAPRIGDDSARAAATLTFQAAPRLMGMEAAIRAAVRGF